jgi:hypothetical protein
MTSREIFEFEVSALEQEIGSSAKMRTYRVLAEVVRWLRQSGHGNVTLSAVNNLLGEKIRTETIISIDRNEAMNDLTV